jgi:DNA-binding NarL/FixJ family response regulator
LIATRGATGETIETVAQGDSLLDPGVTSKVLTRMRDLAAGAHKDPLAELSEQERRILGLIAEGKTNREIASTVYLSEKTVKNYVSTILSKLGMERRAQAAAFLAEQRARGHE